MDGVKWYGDRAISVARQAAIQAIGTCANDLKGKSAEQAPVETGNLRDTCSVSQVQEGNKVFVYVGYGKTAGSQDLPYSIIQHETPWFNHPKGGKWKFLEDPYKENVGRYERYIKNAVKQALAKE